jgi:hypothetical protein
MAFTQVAAPNLSALVSGSPNLYLLQALGFTGDARLMLVQASFADNAVQPTVTQQSIWLYDVNSRSYTSNLGTLLTQDPTALREMDLRHASIAGKAYRYSLVIEHQLRGSADAPQLAWVKDGVLIQLDLLSSLLGNGAQVRAERYELSADGRYLAIQTSSALLAKGQELDTNEVSDIYLIDLNNLSPQKVQRVGAMGSFEAQQASFLGGIYADTQGVSVLFATEASFSNQDKNSEAAEPLGRTDAYLWHSQHTATGLQGTPTITLASAQGATGLAAGGVDSESLWVTASGVIFNSSAAGLTANDNNLANDAFLRASDGTVSRVALHGVAELAQGAIALSSSHPGNLQLLLTELPEDTTTGVQKLVLKDTRTDTWTVVSEKDRAADDSAFGASLSPNGAVLAFNSNATNLVPGQDNSAIGGQLFLTETGLLDGSNAKTISGTVQHWKSKTPMPGVALRAEESTHTSDSSGLFEFTAEPSGEIESLPMTASKAAPGGTAASSGITLTDVLGALKVYLGKPLPEAYNNDLKFIAADFDGNGTVNLTDVLGLLKFYLNKPVNAAPAWVFVDSAESTTVNGQTLHLSSKAGQTLSTAASAPSPILADLNSDESVQLLGVLRGDVDGSWTG